MAFLLERTSSPSRLRLQKLAAKKFPKAKWFVHEAINTDIHRTSASAAFGASVKPYYKYDAAKVIVSLDCDFIGEEEDAHNNIRKFVSGRRIEKPTDTMNRLYVVEGLMTLTGMNADHRLRLASSAVQQFAEALKAAVNGQTDFSVPAGVVPKWISECAADLKANPGASLVVVGQRQPFAVHVLAHALNAFLGNVGKTVLYQEVEDPAANEGDISDFAKSAAQFETIVIIGANPIYNASADVDIKKALTSVKGRTVVRLGYYEDETFPMCDWHLPLAHYLESWGDARTTDGTLVPVQPLLQPLFAGLSEIEILARIAGSEKISPYDIVRATFAEISGGDSESSWRKFLYNGFLENSASKGVSVRAVSGAFGNSGSKAPALGKNNLEVVFHRDYKVDDGRYSNNGWLQELPDPVTKLVWDNAVLISRKTASELGVKNGDLVNVKIGNRSVSGPIWVQPGMADYVLGLALGYGREWNGRIGYKVGFNAYPLRTSDADGFVTGATLSQAGMQPARPTKWSPRRTIGRWKRARLFARPTSAITRSIRNSSPI